jgi:hypothetical protein
MKKNESKISANAKRLSIDPSMDKLSSTILFPAKLEYANTQLKKVGFPHSQSLITKKYQ